MKAKHIIGKTVARVEQAQKRTNSGTHWCLDRIVFTDGTVLWFDVKETEAYYEVTCTAAKDGEVLL